MKVLITYVSAGAGHFKAAEALYNHLKDEQPGIDLRLVDILDDVNFLFKFNYRWGYSALVRYMPLLWQAAFWVTYNKLLRFLSRPIAVAINWMNTGKFRYALIKDNPDFIISTHFLPSEIAVNLKKAGKIHSKVVTIITDFGVHPFWITPGTDLYITASGFTTKLLMNEGVEESRIKETGIPVDEKFLREYNRKEVCAKLGVAQDKFTVLLVTGSFGIGPLEEIASLLHREAQVLVVCARNEKLRRELESKNYQNVKVFGFVENIQELMAVADLIVTKPGGLSIAELLVMELAPVFISPIPGQETANIRALASYGVGVWVKNAQGIEAVVLDYKNDPHQLSLIKERIRKIKKPSAAGEICDVIR